MRAEIVKEYLEKWPDLPSLQLARMIYNDGDNYKLFTNIDNVRSSIRYYRGANGNKSRKELATKKYIRKFKTIEHDN